MDRVQNTPFPHPTFYGCHLTGGNAACRANGNAFSPTEIFPARRKPEKGTLLIRSLRRQCDLSGQLLSKFRERFGQARYDDPARQRRPFLGFLWVAWQLKPCMKPGGVIVWVVADATKDGDREQHGTGVIARLGLNANDTMDFTTGHDRSQGQQPRVIGRHGNMPCWWVSNGHPKQLTPALPGRPMRTVAGTT